MTRKQVMDEIARLDLRLSASLAEVTKRQAVEAAEGGEVVESPNHWASQWWGTRAMAARPRAMRPG